MPASPSEPTPAAQFSEGQTTRAADRFSDVMPATYDEKDDMGLLRQKLEGRKKPIYAGLAFLCVVVIGVSIAVSSGKSTEASVKSGYDAPSVTTPAPTPAPSAADASDTGGVHAADLTTEAKSTSGSGAHGSVAGDAKNEEGFMEPATNATATPVPSSTTTPAPTTPEPTTGPLLPFKALDFDWKDSSKWEYANGSPVPSGMIAQDGIKLTPANSQQPIRTKEGWGGDKIVYIEWERSDSSDTNIWMLNTKLQNQFAVGNGWPYWGELDIFEMFTQDAVNGYDFTGQAELSDVKSYGQLTLHNGPRKEDGQPCFCPWAGSKSSWYQNTKPMTSGCTAQFANTPKNSMATVWGRDGTGQYLQLLQNPTIVLGGKDKQGAQTYDVKPGGVSTMKIYNNKDLFWGTPASSPCAKGGGHNPATGFPFFEDFRLILEEQKKNDVSAWFKVTNIQIFKA